MAKDTTNKNILKELPSPPELNQDSSPEQKAPTKGFFGKLFQKKPKQDKIVKEYNDFISDTEEDTPIPETPLLTDEKDIELDIPEPPKEMEEMPAKKKVAEQEEDSLEGLDIPELPDLKEFKEDMKFDEKPEDIKPQAALPEPPKFAVQEDTKTSGKNKKGKADKKGREKSDIKDMPKPPKEPIDTKQKFELGNIIPEPPKFMGKEVSKPELPAREPVDFEEMPEFHFNELPSKEDEPEALKKIEEEKVNIELPEIDEKELENLEKGFDVKEKEETKLEQIDKKEEEEPKKIIEEKQEEPYVPAALNEVKGIGPKTEQALKKIKIKTVDELAEADHKHVADKLKISEKKAKKIIKHAKKISKKKRASRPQEEQKSGISALIEELEKEKDELQQLKRKLPGKVIKIRGHEDILNLLEKLEKKKLELIEYETKLKEKEETLETHKETHKRDAEYIDKLKRRLDHDIRERTQYLVNLEKEFFNRGQELAKRQSDTELKEEQLKERGEMLQDKEANLKKLEHGLEDKEITVKAKEDKVKNILKEMDKQSTMLRQKEEALEKRELEYLKKLETLEGHEKTVKEELEQKKKDLEHKEKKYSKKLKEAEKTEFLKEELEDERDKLEDDEFKQYLHEKLGLIKETGVTVGDVETTQHLHVPKDSESSDENVSSLIHKCRHLVKIGRINEAKLLYNKVRDKFYNLRLGSDPEKETVYNEIRGLYDEINLADLGK
ncbi:hypothetical protein JW930_06885 [Candidatus Woesearchaeota archaeon]|nr:hypothetical protein [Candidatus Woesearchaeota archaeon]